jgi:hypothetical protein
MINKIIDAYDDIGNNIIDDIVIPLVQSGTNIISDESILYKSYFTLKTAFMKHKIKVFIDYITDEKADTCISFIDSLNNKEKKFFIEVVNKVIDSDDNLQIYLFKYLVQEYKRNSDLNYYQKTLYYNIKTFSENDFYMLYNFIKTLKQPIEYKKFYGTENNDILTLTMKKFEKISLISGHIGGFGAAPINLENKDNYDFAFKMYPFIEELCNLIEEYKETILKG